MSKLENPNWYEEDPIIAVFKHGDRYYVVSDTIKTTHKITDNKQLCWLDKYSYERVTDLLGDMESATAFFLMFNAACAFPPTYIVAADNEQEAWDIFLDDCDACKVGKLDLADYSDPESGDCRLEYNSDGVPQDTEQLTQYPATLIQLIYNE